MLRSIAEFCPSGTQISSPDALSFDPKRIEAIETNSDPRDPKIVLMFATRTLEVHFHRNYNGCPVDVYKIKRMIVEACNGRV